MRNPLKKYYHAHLKSSEGGETATVAGFWFWVSPEEAEIEIRNAAKNLHKAEFITIRFQKI